MGRRKSTTATKGTKGTPETSGQVKPEDVLDAEATKAIKALGIDLTKVSVKDLKKALSAKKALTKADEYKESRELRMAKAKVYLADCEEWAEKAQHKLDTSLVRQEQAQNKVDKLNSKWTGLDEKAITEHMAEIRKERKAKANTSGKK